MSPASAIEPRVELALTGAFGNLESYLRGILKDLHKEKEILVSDQFNLARIDNVIRTLQVEMEALGYRQAIRTQLEGLETLHREILKETKQLDVPEEFRQESEAAVRMLLRGAETELTALGGQASDALGKLLRQGVIGGAGYGDILEEIQTQTGIKRSQAITLARTTLYGFTTSVRVSRAKAAGVKWYWYAGPKDQILREWCSHFVGTRVTLEILNKHADRWDRIKQPKPASLWRGGWNCRHELLPITGKRVEKYPVGPR